MNRRIFLKFLTAGAITATTGIGFNEWATPIIRNKLVDPINDIIVNKVTNTITVTGYNYTMMDVYRYVKAMWDEEEEKMPIQKWNDNEIALIDCNLTIGSGAVITIGQKGS